MKPPLLIYDGDCPFCRRWAQRLERAYRGRLAIAPYQKAATLFPEVPTPRWHEAVALALPEGRLLWGAQAVAQVLALHWPWAWMPWAYRRLPGASAVAERAYHWVAKHRARETCEACGRP